MGTIKIAGIEFYEKELLDAVLMRKNYIVKYNAIYVIECKNGIYNAKKIYTYKPENGIGLIAKRRFYLVTLEEARSIME